MSLENLFFLPHLDDIVNYSRQKFSCLYIDSLSSLTAIPFSMLLVNFCFGAFIFRKTKHTLVNKCSFHSIIVILSKQNSSVEGGSLR